jgi:hypothetical protein
MSNHGKETGGRWEVAAALLRDRRLGWAMAGGGAVYFACSWWGMDFFPCPLRQVTGLPCPGCGLTRSCLAMVRGDWLEMWRQHPFGPVFALFWVVVGVGLCLPAEARDRFTEAVGRFERFTKWPAWVLGGLLIYGLTRWIGQA